MKVTSSAFKENETIPIQYTGDGQDINPPLRIEGIPKTARSLALIVDDPDAPRGTWLHWLVFDIPVRDHIDEDSVPGTQGMNDFRKTDYGGPAPPSGTHHYHFRVYALDRKLDLPEEVSRKHVEDAMRGHILEQAELVGVYSR